VQIISGSLDGEVRIWDIRARRPLTSFNALCSGGSLAALALHRYAPLIASGSDTSTVRPFTHRTSRLLAHAFCTHSGSSQ
jgi:WD40 repeat protein